MKFQWSENQEVSIFSTLDFSSKCSKQDDATLREERPYTLSSGPFSLHRPVSR